MRTATEALGTIRRTIDLTDASVRTAKSIKTPLQQRRMRDAAARKRAIAAFRATRRRRRAHTALDALADGAVATGGLAIVNATMSMDLGLPGGFAGIAMGLGLIGIGAAIALAHRRYTGGDDPAAAAATADRTIVLDEKSSDVVYLDAPPAKEAATHNAA